MSLPDPTQAPARTDLPFLRTHSRRAPAVATHLDLRHHPAAVPASSSLDLSAVARPTQVPAPRRRPAPTRAASGVQTLLSSAVRTVTLTRLQSGVGALVVEAACSAAVGDLQLGCAYVLADGVTSTVQHDRERNAPSGATSPVLQAQQHEFSTVAVDLKRVADITRLLVFAFSPSRTPLQWAGTLLMTTYADASVECPLEIAEPSPVAALVTVFNVGGELVLRREVNGAFSTVRAACLAYGFDRIAWLDDWTPIT